MDGLGIWIKKERKAKKLTQQDVAEALYVTPQAVSKWERGESLPDITLLPDIARLFSMSVGDLFDALEKKEAKGITDFSDNLTNLVPRHVYETLLEQIQNSYSAKDIHLPLKIFLLLDPREQEEILHAYFNLEDYDIFVEDLMPYLDMKLRILWVYHMLEKEAYHLLDILIPFLNNEVKAILLQELLDRDEMDMIENILPFLNETHYQLIIQFIMDHQVYLPFLDDLEPFLKNKNMMKSTRKRVNEHER